MRRTPLKGITLGLFFSTFANATGPHIEPQIPFGPRALGPESYAVIRNIRMGLTSPDPQVTLQALLAAQTLVRTGQAQALDFRLNGVDLPGILNTPTLGRVDLARNTEASQRSREIASAGARIGLSQLRQGMGEPGLDLVAFQRSIANLTNLNDANAASLGKQFGAMINRRFSLGILPGGPDARMSAEMKALWGRAQRLADGTDVPRNEFDRQILAAYRAGQPNRQAFRDAAEAAIKTGNSQLLANWTENLPEFIQNLRRTAADPGFLNEATAKQRQDFLETEARFKKLFDVSSLSDIPSDLNASNILSSIATAQSRRQNTLAQGTSPGAPTDVRVLPTENSAPAQ